MNVYNKKTPQQKSWSEKLTDGIGSKASLAIHTVLFVVIFGLYFFGISFDSILLILTTAVSLEAIYLAIFIQMTVNKSAMSLAEVESDLDEIQTDIDEIQKDIDEIQKDIDEIEDVEEQEAETDNKTKTALEGIQTKLKQLSEDLTTIKPGR